MITIEKAENGWIVRTAESVIEEIFQHTELFERLKFLQVLNHINDLVGPQQNAFGEHGYG